VLISGLRYADLATFRGHIENDPNFIPSPPKPSSNEPFSLLPKTAVTVEPIPPFQAAAATHYQGGTPDGKRPGRVSVAVSDPHPPQLHQ
jgi:hypothetical protein